MHLSEDQIREFCKKHSMNWGDRSMQYACIEEEVCELGYARQHEELEEAVDVIITVLVFAEISGWLDELEDEFRRKMDINIAKPKRIGRGKVKKG